MAAHTTDPLHTEAKSPLAKGPTAPEWRKSSHSENGGACVEAATNLAPSTGTVPIRDSKRPATTAVLTLPAPAFAAFVAAVKAGKSLA